MGYLIFIDTNIFLDLYRDRGNRLTLSLFGRIDSHHDKVITTSQVEMEYKKNRQGEILKSLEEIGSSNWPGLKLPSFLRGSPADKAIQELRKKSKTEIETLKSEVEGLFRQPEAKDPVYQIADRLFRSGCDIHLMRTNELRHKIRDFARKRFELGYPPRKPRDTHFGDAINWEWIVRCAKVTGHNVFIVARDTDYGQVEVDNPVINDWLRQEFRERVDDPKRQLKLSRYLVEAFEEAGIKVTEKEAEAERKQVGALDSLVRGTLRLREQLDAFHRFMTRPLTAGDLAAMLGASRLPETVGAHDVFEELNESEGEDQVDESGSGT